MVSWVAVMSLQNALDRLEAIKASDKSKTVTPTQAAELLDHLDDRRTVSSAHLEQAHKKLDDLREDIDRLGSGTIDPRDIRGLNNRMDFILNHPLRERGV